MATGLSNKLVGQVGEFLVCAELGRRGLIATPFSGNVPGFDIIATDERCRSVPIQVKTVRTGDWPADARRYLEIEFDARTGVQRVVGLSRLSDPDTVMVFVRLRNTADELDRFFVLTRQQFQTLIRKHYESFLTRHSGRRPRTPGSFVIRIRPHV